MEGLNQITFTPEEVKKGLHIKLIKFFDLFNKESEDYFIESHITTDSYCTTVEFTKRPLDTSYGGSFRYVDEEHEVVKQVVFPDNHYEYLLDEDVDEYLNQWKKEHETEIEE